MTEILIEEFATKNFTADKMNIVLQIEVFGKKSEICEHNFSLLINKMNNALSIIGIDIKKLKGNGKIKSPQYIYNDKNIRNINGYKCIEIFIMELPIDMELVNKISEVLKDIEEISYRIHYGLFNYEEQEKEVVKACINKSKEKAKLVVEEFGGTNLKCTKIDFSNSINRRSEGLMRDEEIVCKSVIKPRDKFPTETPKDITILSRVFTHWSFDQ